MSKRRITALKDVRTLEVSLVEAGANMKKRFPIMKSRSDHMDEILVEVLKAEGQSDAVEKLESLLKMEMPEDAKKAVMAAMKLLEAYSDMMPVGEALAALRSASGEEPEPEPEEVKVEARESELGVEIAKRARREYLAKAEKTLCNIPGHSLEQVVDLMIDVKARDADLGSRVEKALEAASAAMQGGPLLVEAGRNVPDMSAGDPWSRIQQIAKSEVEASGGKLKMPAAIAKTIQTNPALYSEYNEQRQSNGGR